MRGFSSLEHGLFLKHTLCIVSESTQTKYWRCGSKFSSCFSQALGNHEFDKGVSGLLDPLLQNANFTILSANIKGKTPLGNEMMKYVHPFKIVHFDSESIGIVGYTTKETSFLSQPGMFSLIDKFISFVTTLLLAHLFEYKDECFHLKSEHFLVLSVYTCTIQLCNCLIFKLDKIC